MRFEKVSKEAFIKDCEKWLDKLIIYDYLSEENKTLDIPKDKMLEYFEQAYEKISIPVRSTSGSAGYDFKNPFTEFTFCDVIFIPTGIRVFLDKDKILQITPRSSASKKRMMLANTIGIIDSDYVNADNEGDIIIALKNVNLPYDITTIAENEKIAQGIILPFYTVDDDNANGIRTGGFGSTGK